MCLNSSLLSSCEQLCGSGLLFPCLDVTGEPRQLSACPELSGEWQRRLPGTRATQRVPRCIRSLCICGPLLKPERAPMETRLPQKVRGDPAVTDRDFTWTPLFFTDPSGQLRCHREQGHRLVAQALWDPSAFRLTARDFKGSLQALSEHSGHVTGSTNWLEITVLLWCSKCNPSTPN